MPAFAKARGGRGSYVLGMPRINNNRVGLERSNPFGKAEKRGGGEADIKNAVGSKSRQVSTNELNLKVRVEMVEADGIEPTT